MFGAREAPCQSAESTVVRVSTSPGDRMRGRETRRREPSGSRAREKSEKKRSGGEGGREAVGVPSYLVIYSPRAPGYPSRGITQGWAHRTPKMSLLAGHRHPGEFRLASTLDRARPPFRFITRVSSFLDRPPSGYSPNNFVLSHIRPSQYRDKVPRPRICQAQSIALHFFGNAAGAT